MNDFFANPQAEMLKVSSRAVIGERQHGDAYCG